MMRILRTALVSMALLSVAFPCTIEIKKPTKLRQACGVVLLPDGKPLARVGVRLQSAPRSAQGFIKVVTTDADGAFSFGEVPKGTYFLNTDKETHWDIASEIRVTRQSDEGRKCEKVLYVVASEKAGCGDGSLSFKRPDFAHQQQLEREMKSYKDKN